MADAKLEAPEVTPEVTPEPTAAPEVKAKAAPKVKARREKFEATRPDGTVVIVDRNIDTGEQTVTEK